MFSLCRSNKKKSKSLSEVKSFSSFSFSDVALDYKLYKSKAVGEASLGGKNGKSHHLSQSDPSTLDRLENSSQVANILFSVAIDFAIDGIR